MTLHFEADEAKALVEDITEYLTADPLHDEEFQDMIRCLERIRTGLERALGHTEILLKDGGRP